MFSQPNDWQTIDGHDVEKVYEVSAEAIAHMRAGKGPVFLWAMMERLSSHTSSDDHKLYRSADEIADAGRKGSDQGLERAPDRARRSSPPKITKDSIAKSRNAFAKNMPTQKRRKILRRTNWS